MKIFAVWYSSVSLDGQMLFPPQVPVNTMLFEFHFLLTVGQAELACFTVRLCLFIILRPNNCCELSMKQIRTYMMTTMVSRM